VALGGEARAALAEVALEDVVAVVERVDQVRGRATGLAARDGAVVENYDPLALAREQVRGRHARDACADDDHVGLRVRVEPAFARRVARPHPDRSRCAVVRVHSSSPLWN
jgi:hypothetical protein